MPAWTAQHSRFDWECERKEWIFSTPSLEQRNHAYRAGGRKTNPNPNPNPLSIMQVVIDRCSENPWPCRRRDAWLNESKIDTRQSIRHIHKGILPNTQDSKSAFNKSQGELLRTI
jgi:hypothetical protein